MERRQSNGQQSSPKSSQDNRIDVRYIVPEILSDLKKYLALSYLPKYCKRSLLKANRTIKDKYRGEEVYILANGPSLKAVDLSRLYGKKIIVMNHFEQHPLKDRFQIVAHCIGEPYLCKTWEDPKLMLEGVLAESYWFSSDAWAYFQGRSMKNIHYYCGAVGPKFKFKSGVDLADSALRYQSTAQMAMMVAIYMGFETVKLLGFDHDWLVSRGISQHFYEEKEDIAKADLSIFTYRERIQLSLSLFDTYYRIRDIASERGVRIINMTVGTYLDVFEQGEFQ